MESEEDQGVKFSFTLTQSQKNISETVESRTNGKKFYLKLWRTPEKSQNMKEVHCFGTAAAGKKLSVPSFHSLYHVHIFLP